MDCFGASEMMDDCVDAVSVGQMLDASERYLRIPAAWTGKRK